MQAPMQASEFYSADYRQATLRFREAAAAAGAISESLPLEAQGPDGTPLAIDVAWFGAEQPRRVLLHTAGLHGIEGFAGSAIQLAVLTRLPHPPAKTAIAFLHVLNPYGMAWLRRVNENNVDLNRNFLAPGEEYRGAAEAYRNVYTMLNPRSAPQRLDFFLPQAGAAILRYGFANLKQAVAEGQYEFPQGLFFGGHRMEESAAVVLAWAKRRLAGAQRLFVIDIHTGLGCYGEDVLLVERRADPEADRRLRERLGPRAQPWHKSGVAYGIRGGFVQALERELPAVEVTAVGQEFGTYSPVKVIYALREENRQHQWGEPRDLAHRAKRRLLATFCPADPAWRRSVVERGQAFFAQAAKEQH
jgi:hypothetical protein